MTNQTHQPRWHNASYWLAHNLGQRLSGMARMVLVAYLLVPEEAPLGFLSISVGGLSLALLTSGTSQVVIAGKRCDEETLVAAWSVELLKGLGLALGLVLLALVAELFLEDSHWPGVLLMAALVPLSVAFNHPSLYQWERDGRHGRAAFALSMGSFFATLVCALGLLLLPRWWVVPLGAAFGNLSTAALTHYWGAGRFDLSTIDVSEATTLFRRGVPYLGMGIATYLSTLGMDFALGVFGAVEWIVPMRFAMALVFTVLSALPAVLMRAGMSADAARLRASDQGVGIGLHSPSLTVVACVTVGLVPLCSLLLPHASLFLFGDDWRQTQEVIPLLSTLIGLRMLSRPFANIYLYSEDPRGEARVLLAETAVATLMICAFARTDIRIGILLACGVTFTGLAFRVHLLRTRIAQQLKSSTVVTAVAGIFVMLGGLLQSPALQIATCLVGPGVVATAWRVTRERATRKGSD